MSYDITIGDESFNHTSNQSAMWYRHIPPNGLKDLDGKTGKEAVAILSVFFDSLHREYLDDWQSGVAGNPRFTARYDASNGWGSTISAIMFVARVMAACHRALRKKVRVDY